MILELHATPEEVMRAVEALREFGESNSLGESEIFGLTLALEESGSNIVNHALRRDPDQTFHVSFERAANTIVITLRDRGIEFDPTRVAEGKQTADDCPGGWGIQLVRRYVDEIRYRRENGANVLVLSRRLAAKSGEK